MSDKPTIAFPKGMLPRIDALCKARGLSRSAFVVRACIAALDSKDFVPITTGEPEAAPAPAYVPTPQAECPRCHLRMAASWLDKPSHPMPTAKGGGVCKAVSA